MIKKIKASKESIIATRERLLDAAEKLFAEDGFEATSVRDITEAAKCGNVAAINYYFGSKDKLYEACLLGLFCDLKGWREQRIQKDMTAFGENPSMRDFLGVFVHTFLDELGDEERRLRLDALIEREIRSARLHPARFNEELIHPVRVLTTTYLSSLAPDLDNTTVELCIEFLMGHLVHARRLRNQLRNDRHLTLSNIEEAELVSKIVSFAAGGIRACIDESIDKALVTKNT